MTGYSSKSSSNKEQNEHLILTDPSTKKVDAQIKRNFDAYRENAI